MSKVEVTLGTIAPYIFLLNKKKLLSMRIGVVIGVPLSDPITIEAANIWGEIF